MKHNYTIKRTLSAMLLLMMSTLSWAYDFDVDGINYNINEDGESVEVTYGFYFGGYSGDIVIPSTVTYDNKTYSVTRIGDYAFYSCTFLTSISIPESVTSIGNNPFDSCYSLKDAKFASVESMCRISYATSGSNPCYYAENLYIDGELVTSISIPEGVTSIGNYAFQHCSSLTSISIPEGVTSIGNYAFDECSSLTSISIPESVTSIGNFAFFECTSLTSISIPEGVTSIGNSAFSDCYFLTSISIPEGVTSIGNSAFYDCSSLTSISIPESVTSIGNQAFSGCSSLVSVICHAENVPSITYNTFRYTSLLRALYVPASAVEAYKATDYWKDIENIFAIEDGIKLTVGEAGLATFCPIIDIDLSEVDNIAAYKATVDGNTVNLNRTYTIGVGEGVLLRSINGGSTEETIAIKSGVKKDPAPNDFVGVVEDTYLTETDKEGNTNFVLSRHKDGTVGFYKVRDNTLVSAGKAYLPVPNYTSTESDAKGLRLVFDDDNATGIDIAEAKQAEADGAYYTLSGVKVETPTAKGIYIKNGKKYIIK